MTLFRCQFRCCSILTLSAVVRYLIILQERTNIGWSLLLFPPKILVYVSLLSEVILWKTKPVGPLHTIEESWLHQFTNIPIAFDQQVAWD